MTRDDKLINVFGVTINNVYMTDAIDMISTVIDSYTMQKSEVTLGFFVNVNSYNIASKDYSFYCNLIQPDHIFADGIGVKIAAKKAGYRLKDNVNGTDMLPLLCERLKHNKKGIFFLGGEEGIAKKAARNMSDKFSGLVISGCRNGFFDHNETDTVINEINQSNCAILLVAFGSPLQEKWLIDNKDKLKIPYALAVGGLFDFYSGKIKRAPPFVRQIKCEWVWRLKQEPKRMWRRYILGNPLFLIRTFFNKKELTK